MKKVIVYLLIIILLSGLFIFVGYSIIKKNKSYTVIWKNYDGTILETDYNVKKGDMPSYDGITPLRQETDEYFYEFIGWNNELVSVNEDVVYIAKYKSTNKYTGETTYGDLQIGEWDIIK